MFKRLIFLTTYALSVVLSVSLSALAQDRAALEKEIEALREQLKQKETEFLAPSAGDRAAFADFLSQPDTGLARVMPREKYREKLSVREGGAYYSFTRLSNSYNDDPQIGLEQNTLRTGFAGADFGFLTSLGDVPLETVGLNSEGVSFLAEFVAPLAEPGAREQQRKTNAGFAAADHNYRASLPAVLNHTYVTRSISYDRFDVLVAFRIVRRDTDGSLILLWKKLKEFPTPYLVRQQPGQ
ncbi:MAG TPA: hypothetical protein VLM38_15675 [Blastocatellia bacterium]|nr:hypothetical protein [Blastocatellia bacterium]